MGDLYQFAGDDQLGLTFCVPLQQEGEFYAALCDDFNISQKPIKFQGKNDKSESIYSKPLVL